MRQRQGVEETLNAFERLERELNDNVEIVIHTKKDNRQAVGNRL